ncbi:MAG TPA: Hsp70 family protein [Gemmataceae bacterium]|nr:Hsp70 family protein [Gemmataceae bacterium]
MPSNTPSADPIVGIDLGTTNSEIAIIRDGQPYVFAEDGDPILPSFVGLSEDGRLLVGKAARNQWVIAPERTIKSIKRKMGQDVKVRLGNQEYRPQEISAMILRTLRDRAARELGVPIKRAVITVPAYFNDAQRQVTREAGELAGLEVVRILNEPTAASLTYDPSHRELRRLLVYDLGGGTFDVSIVQAQESVVEVLASHGDTQLGGDDFDDLLLKHVCDRFQEEHGIDLRADRIAKARLLRAVEAAKCHLSYHPFARIEEEFIAEKNGVALHLNLEISRQEYERMIRPLLDRTMDCMRRALEDAHLTPSQIDKVVLVGGATRTPLVTQLLEERLGQPAHQEVNPDLCVAMGAAIQAAIIAGTEVGAVLVDITPHSLGIKCLDEVHGFPFEYRFAPIIKRGTPLPASRSEVFHTVHDRQTEVDIDVYQGESDDVRRNHRVGRFLIQGLAPVPAGNQIVVQLDLNLDGMLKVSAREKATGLQKQITIDNALARFEREEREIARERLERLWEEWDQDIPEDREDLEDLENESEPVEVPSLVPGPREGQREAVQARALLEKAERLLDRVAPEDRSEVERQMEKVRIALTDRKWDQVTQACNELADILFYLEDV